MSVERNSPDAVRGCGIGLRPAHYGDFASTPPRVAWVEAVTENFLAPGGKQYELIERVRARAPVGLHGVEMCLGDAGPLSAAYLRDLRSLVRRIEPAFVSDHLAWGRHLGSHAHDLLPLPHLPETVAHVAERVMQVQDFLGRRIALENVSSYARFTGDVMSECEFVVAVAEAADCQLLVDVNNVVVNAHNHGFDADAYIDAIPAHRVQQIHIAGHTDCGTHLLDTHIGPVPESVWALYRRAIRRFGRVPTLLEWDQDVPPMATMLAEVARADREAGAALAPRRALA